MRLKLVPQNTSWDFFARSKLWIGFSVILIILSLISFFVQSLNFGRAAAARRLRSAPRSGPLRSQLYSQRSSARAALRS